MRCGRRRRGARVGAPGRVARRGNTRRWEAAGARPGPTSPAAHAGSRALMGRGGAGAARSGEKRGEVERSGEARRESGPRRHKARRGRRGRRRHADGAWRSTLLRHRRPRLPPSSGCVPSSSTSPAMPAHRTPGGGEWRLVNFGAASGALLRPPQASKLLRRRSGICGGGLSLRSHQAGSWGGVLQQGGEGASHQLARRRA